jgi:hypothetical protein
MTVFTELINACMDLVEPRDIVEVGSESGANTQALLAWADEHGAALHCVDPAPDPSVVALASAHPALRLIRGASPAALPQLDSGGVWLLDGDHNYHTVSAELAFISERASHAGEPFVTILHDTRWPYGRRDLYYAPDRLPPNAVRPHSFGLGVVLDEQHAVPGGFRGEGMYAIALEEGGPGNGVMTAVEDLLESEQELVSFTVPCVFGLTFVYPESAAWASALGELLVPLDGNPLLEAMERNRIELYLAVLRLQDELSLAALRSDRLIASRELRIAELEARALQPASASPTSARDLDLPRSRRANRD